MLKALQAQAEALIGRLLGIADGDTPTVLDASLMQHKIRLAGIDAPEKSQPFGDRPKHILAAMVFNKAVTTGETKKSTSSQSAKADAQLVRHLCVLAPKKCLKLNADGLFPPHRAHTAFSSGHSRGES